MRAAIHHWRGVPTFDMTWATEVQKVNETEDPARAEFALKIYLGQSISPSAGEFLWQARRDRFLIWCPGALAAATAHRPLGETSMAGLGAPEEPSSSNFQIPGPSK